jgi:ketosteroid isomerase-like protein
MSLARLAFAAVAVFGLVGCAGVPSAARQDAASAMIAADGAFSDACSRHDAAATGALIAEDAVFISPRGLLRGRAEVLEGWKALLSENGPVLEWLPNRADASDSGEYGFTVGEWRLKEKNGEVASGEYVTVWRRDPDGRFRALLDSPLREGSVGSASRVSVREVRSKAGDLTADLGTLPAAAGGAETSAYLVVSRARDGRLAPAVETVVPLSSRE